MASSLPGRSRVLAIEGVGVKPSDSLPIGRVVQRVTTAAVML